MLDIFTTIHNGFTKYNISYFFDEDGVVFGDLIFDFHDWKKSIIIDRLVRSQYSQDMVEAIINNHFLNISEWLDKKFKGEDVDFVDQEYDKLQNWRKKCKEIANEAFAKYPEN
jgi:hypothetical protein